MRRSTIKISWIIVFLAYGNLSVCAQTDYPRVEVFGGYSYAHIQGAPLLQSHLIREDSHANGWAFAVSGNFHKNFAELSQIFDREIQGFPWKAQLTSTQPRKAIGG